MREYNKRKYNERKWENIMREIMREYNKRI